MSSAAAMLPAARLALPPRLARRPPLSWRWGAARPLGTGRARRRSEALAGEALAGAPLDTAAKEYSPKVRQLVRDIAGLTLLEVADLNALLKVGPRAARPRPTPLGPRRPLTPPLFPQETLKIPDVGVMPAGAAAHLPAQAAPQVRRGDGGGWELSASPSPHRGCLQEEEEAVPMKKEKTHFSVRLTELKATDKVKLIKEVKNFVPGINLVQVRTGLPQPKAVSALRAARVPPRWGSVCPGPCASPSRDETRMQNGTRYAQQASLRGAPSLPALVLTESIAEGGRGRLRANSSQPSVPVSFSPNARDAMRLSEELGSSQGSSVQLDLVKLNTACHPTRFHSVL